jgi:hypothetical protein
LLKSPEKDINGARFLWKKFCQHATKSLHRPESVNIFGKRRLGGGQRYAQSTGNQIAVVRKEICSIEQHTQTGHTVSARYGAGGNHGSQGETDEVR